MADATATKASEGKTPTKAKGRSPEEPHHTQSTNPYDRILSLQQTLGNQAVGRLLQSDNSCQSASISNLPPVVQSVLGRANGQPLDTTTLADIESHDFSQVKGQTNGKAEESSRGVNAVASTVKQGIAVNTGEYPPKTHQQTSTTSSLSKGGILQRKCVSCGQDTVAGGECAECAKKKSGLQRKLTIGASNDPLEREADQVADQVMAARAHSAVGDAPPRIQRFTGQTAGRADMAAPASVDRVLSRPGSPLEPALWQDMGQRFGHDFSQVRVHTDAVAERSAREVNANAYTVGHNVVFGAGRFAPGTHEGRRLIAHELTHVVQQSDSGGVAFDRRENRGVSPVGFGSGSREQDRGRHHESATNPVGAAVDKGGKLPAISAGAARSLFRSPMTPDESEEERRKAGAAGSNKPISTAADSTEGFNLNLAQRGFDFVDYLRSAIARNKQRIAELEKQIAAASTAAERDKLNAEITRCETHHHKCAGRRGTAGYSAFRAEACVNSTHQDSSSS